MGLHVVLAICILLHHLICVGLKCVSACHGQSYDRNQE